MQNSLSLKLSIDPRRELAFNCTRYSLSLGKTTRIMGILNVTSDSFSKDGIYQDPEQAKDRALKMVEEGADIIDIGGESTRPGAAVISPKEEKERVLPVIRKLAKQIKVPLSVDTTKSQVAQAALAEGASIINDISGLKFDAQMSKVIAQFKAGCILMHIQGTPQTMQNNPVYTSLIEEIMESLKESVSWAMSAGIEENQIILDPGIGFGKTAEQNLKILKNLRDFAALGFPILVGPSRKSFIGTLLDLPVEERLWGTAASVAVSILNGAHIVRVHDVPEMAQLVRMVDAILNC